MIVRALALSTAAVLATATLTSATVAAPRDRAAVITPRPSSLPDPDVVVTDGAVSQLLRRDDEVFVRGDFTKVGHYAGPAVALDPTTGSRDADFPELDGTVSAALADGEGGWYVGGDFTRVGTTERRAFAHLASDGTVDPALDLRLPAESMVTSFALLGDTLYLGGFLTTVGGLPRPGVAAISTTDGAVLPFRTRVPSYDAVTELAARPASGDTDARVYLGTYAGVRAVDATTGAAITSFRPAPDVGSNALAVVDGSLYADGPESVLRLDPETGATDPGFVATDTGDDGGIVNTIQGAGGRLYVGGSFTGLGGTHRALAVLDPETGSADPRFTASVAGAQHAVYDVALTSAGLWIAGDFATVDGRVARNLALLDPQTGARLAAAAPRFDDEVDTIEVGDGALLTGGRFFMPDYTAARNAVVLDADTLQLERTLAVPGLAGSDLLPTDGPLYAGRTHFKGYSPSRWARQRHRFYRSTTDRVAAVDPATGAGVPGRGFTVRNLTGLDTTRTEVVSVRRLEDDARFPRNEVVVRDARTGRVTRTFRLPLRGYVSEIEVLESGAMYVAGSFRRFRADGQAAHLAILRLRSDGTLDSSFDPNVDGPVYDVAQRDSTVYASGLFDRYLSRAPLDGVAAFDTSGSLRRHFRPSTSRYGRDDLRLTPFGSRLLLDQTYPVTVVSTYDGRRLPQAVDGYADVVTTALADGAGVVYAGDLGELLEGWYGGRSTFVARSTSP